MVQNSPAIDLSKVESQAPGERRRSADTYNLTTLMQDILCFFILLSLGLLIVASIFCVALNIHQSTTYQGSQRHKSGNMSHLMPADGPRMQERLNLHKGPIWIRFFHCQKKYQQPDHDAKLEQVREPEGDMVRTEELKEQDKPQLRFDYSDLAGGQFARAKATVKESASGLQTFPVDKF